MGDFTDYCTSALSECNSTKFSHDHSAQDGNQFTELEPSFSSEQKQVFVSIKLCEKSDEYKTYVLETVRTFVRHSALCMNETTLHRIFFESHEESDTLIAAISQD